ncbi:Mov34/MPN/PAD-1 family protein [Mycolicibacterium psychrotolerans]|uniref:Mov34/MPN/PAD-1 family protein n=1 Tax=Mycolicibacterium psychrotolerans TaxID=216929 RepID=UPI003D67172C
MRHLDTRAQPPVAHIAPTALRVIVREALRSCDGLETGGILLGPDMADTIFISRAGDPGPRAHRTERSFQRDLAHAQSLADAAWEEDGHQWIGEWHTHPSGEMTPSALDLHSYFQHLHDPELHLDRFVAIIVGLTPHGAVPAAWLIERDSVRALALNTHPSTASPKPLSPQLQNPNPADNYTPTERR